MHRPFSLAPVRRVPSDELDRVFDNGNGGVRGGLELFSFHRADQRAGRRRRARCVPVDGSMPRHGRESSRGRFVSMSESPRRWHRGGGRSRRRSGDGACLRTGVLPRYRCGLHRPLLAHRRCRGPSMVARSRDCRPREGLVESRRASAAGARSPVVAARNGVSCSSAWSTRTILR